MRKICFLLIPLFAIDGSQAQIHKEQSIEGNITSVLAPSRFVLGSAIVAVFMSLNTIIAANNAQLLIRKIGKK